MFPWYKVQRSSSRRKPGSRKLEIFNYLDSRFRGNDAHWWFLSKGFIFLFALLLLCSGCAQTKASSRRSAQPISSLATKRGTTQPVWVKIPVETGKAVWGASTWLLKELFMPLETGRRWFINTFGVVTEEHVVEKKNIPPTVTLSPEK